MSRPTGLLHGTFYIRFVHSITGTSTIAFRLFEGERSIAQEDHFLAQVELTSPSPETSNTPPIEVTVPVDLDGVVHLVAVDTQRLVAVHHDLRRVEPDRDE